MRSSKFNFTVFMFLIVSIILNLCFTCYIWASDQTKDAIQYAQQLGRLDLISLLLTVVTIVLVLGGVFAYLRIKEDSQQIAKAVAKEIAKEVAAEKAMPYVKKYLEENLPTLLSDLQKLMLDTPDSSVADGIASNQDEVG